MQAMSTVLPSRLGEVANPHRSAVAFRWLVQDAVAGPHRCAHDGTTHRHPMRGARIAPHLTMQNLGPDVEMLASTAPRVREQRIEGRLEVLPHHWSPPVRLQRFCLELP